MLKKKLGFRIIPVISRRAGITEKVRSEWSHLGLSTTSVLRGTEELSPTPYSLNICSSGFHPGVSLPHQEHSSMSGDISVVTTRGESY